MAWVWQGRARGAWYAVSEEPDHQGRCVFGERFECRHVHFLNDQGEDKYGATWPLPPREPIPPRPDVAVGSGRV